MSNAVWCSRGWLSFKLDNRCIKIGGMYKLLRNQKKGFTLIELIIVVSVLALLSAFVFVAVDPGRRFEEARNSARWLDVQSLADALKLYQLDHDGDFPAGIDGSLRMIGTADSGCDLVCGSGVSNFLYQDEEEFDLGQYLGTVFDAGVTLALGNVSGQYLSEVIDSDMSGLIWSELQWNESVNVEEFLRMEVGSVEVDSDFVLVNLAQSYDDPVVFTLYHADDNDLPASVRLRNVGSDSFEVRLQNPGEAPLVSDTLHYLVIEEGVYTLGDGTKIEVSTMDTDFVAHASNNWNGVAQSYTHSFDSDPVVLHQIQTYNDSDWITTWVSRNNSRSNPPNTSGFQISLNGAEAETSHGEETIAWMAIEQGVGLIDGIAFEVQRTSDSVQGYGNGCDNFDFDNVFGTVPMVIGNKQEADGTDGGWLVGCDLSAGEIGLQIEEDQENDSERNHTSETAAFIAFAQEFVFESGFSAEFFVRSCNDPLCDGESFLSIVDPGSLIVPNNRYFQFRFDLASDLAGQGVSITDVQVTTGVGELTADECVDLSDGLQYYLGQLPVDPVDGDDQRTYYAVRNYLPVGIGVTACKAEGDRDIHLRR